MKTTQAASILALLMLPLVGPGYVSSNPIQEHEMDLLQRDGRSAHDSHLARYQEHLASLEIDRLTCR